MWEILGAGTNKEQQFQHSLKIFQNGTDEPRHAIKIFYEPNVFKNDEQGSRF